MASGNSIFRNHFILIVLVFHALVVVSGMAWVYLEYQSCTEDAAAIRTEDIARYQKEAEYHVRIFVSRMENRLISGSATEISEKEAARAVGNEQFGERGFLFLFFPESCRIGGKWHGKEHLVSVAEFSDTAGMSFLKEPCVKCLETGRSRWLRDFSTGWGAGHDKWSFYLFPQTHQHWVVGAGLDMAETTRTADAYMKLARKHLLHFAIGMVLFLVAMLLATLGVAFLLARDVRREIRAYGGSLKRALASGDPLEPQKNKLQEFRKLAEITNTLFSDRKTAEEDRRKTEEQYRKLFETNAVSIWVEDFSAVRSMLDKLKAEGVTDPEAYFKNYPEFVTEASKAIRILDINKETLRMYGADSKEQFFSSLEVIFSPDSNRGFAFLLAGLFREERLIRYEEVNHTLVGQDIFVLITVTVDETEDFKRLIVSLVDITDRRQVEEDLAEEKDRLAATLHSIGDGVLVTDAQGRVIVMNPAAGRMTGYEPSDVLGYPLEQVYRVITVGNGYGVDDTTRVFFKAEDLEIVGEEKVLISADGNRYLIDESRSPILGSNEKFRGLATVFRDITELRRTQAHFARVKRLESLGLMAAGIAHDFNNVMTSVFGNISLARMLSEPGSKVAEKLGVAEQAIERARELTSKLITFSRGGAPIGKPVALSGVILNSVEKAVGKAATHWTADIEDPLWPVELDVSQFVHVVNNVVRNALEAMDGGGELKIRVKNTEIDESSFAVSPGKYVRLTFSDTGHGIREEDLDRIFDPYFTTRDGAQGLGLSIAYGIVKRHSGDIRVESEPGKGCRLEILFPALPFESDENQG